jgi:hypothetical protein
MAYNPKDNPLNGVKVEYDTCESRGHWVDLLIWGGCTSCLRAFTVPNENSKVFERLENIKKYCA